MFEDTKGNSLTCAIIQFTQLKSLCSCSVGSNMPWSSPSMGIVILLVSEIIRTHVIRHHCAQIRATSFDKLNIILQQQSSYIVSIFCKILNEIYCYVTQQCALNHVNFPGRSEASLSFSVYTRSILRKRINIEAQWEYWKAWFSATVKLELLILLGQSDWDSGVCSVCGGHRG